MDLGISGVCHMHSMLSFFYFSLTIGDLTNVINATKYFLNVGVFFIHMNNTHTKERNFICDQCDYKAKTSMLLKKHIKTVHLSEVKRTKCEEGDEMEVQCYYCSKMFMNTG